MSAPDAISADDRFAMEDVLGRYLWAVDTGDLEGVLAVFASGAVVRYAGGPRYEGEDGLKHFAQRAIGDASAAGRMHLNQILFAETTGDTVLLRSYVVVPRAGDDHEAVRITTVRYTEDRLRRTPEGWRICERSIFPSPRAAIDCVKEHEKSASTR